MIQVRLASLNPPLPREWVKEFCRVGNELLRKRHAYNTVAGPLKLL